ncbi:MAG: M56 family metallopeptidase [Kofleriaceae bacterium]
MTALVSSISSVASALLAGAAAHAWQATLLLGCAYLAWSAGLWRRHPAAWTGLWIVVLLRWALPWTPAVPGSLSDLWARGWGTAEAAATGPGGPVEAVAASASIQWAPILLVLAWLLLSARRLSRVRARAQQQRRDAAALPPPPAWVITRVRELSAALRISSPRVVVHPERVVPHLLVGAREALLVLPRALLDDREQATVALAHELAHLRRRDPLVRWLLTVVQAVWFFAPLDRCIGRPLERCQEMAADALARRTLALEPERYARLLVGAALRCQRAAPAAALALGGRSPLLERVEALCTHRARASAGGLGAAVIAGVAVLGLGAARSPSDAASAPPCEYSPALAEALREVHPEADRDGDGELGREEACALQEQLRRSAREGLVAGEQVSRAEPPLWQRLCCDCESSGARPVRVDSLPGRAPPAACEQE